MSLETNSFLQKYSGILCLQTDFCSETNRNRSTGEGNESTMMEKMFLGIAVYLLPLIDKRSMAKSCQKGIIFIFKYIIEWLQIEREYSA